MTPRSQTAICLKLFDDGQLTPQRLIRLLLPTTSLVVIVLSLAGAFIGLETSSLWTDELFSAYFADPALPSFSAALARAAEDVNAPGYYLLLWKTLQSTGMEFALGSRGLSALLGTLAILALVLAPTKRVGLSPRLLAAAFASTSLIWFTYTQEARAYALVFLLVVGMVASALRSLDGLLAGRVPVLPLAALSVFSLAASLSHYYAILLAGALFTMLLPFCRSFREFVGVIVSGCLVLVPFVAVFFWHTPQIIIDIQDTWFSSEFAALKSQTIGGLQALIGSWRALPLLLVLAALALWAILSRGLRDCWAALTRDQIGAALMLLIGSFLLAYLYAIAVTFAFAPMLSKRFFIAMAPVTWISLAYVTHVVLTLMDSSIRALAATISLSLAVLMAGTMVMNRGGDSKQPWRHSAEEVASLPGCTAATLPVVWWEQPYMSVDNPERFYGFYLLPDPDREWLALNRHQLRAELDRPEMAELVRETAAGQRVCPLLLWSVHMSVGDPTDVAEVLEAHAGERVTVVDVRPRTSGPAAYLFVLDHASDNH